MPESESVSCSVMSLCYAMDGNLPGSSVHGILLARTLEWVAIPFSRGSFWPRDRTWVSCVAGRFFIVWATRESPLILTFNYFFSLSPTNCVNSMKAGYLSHSALFSWRSLHLVVNDTKHLLATAPLPRPAFSSVQSLSRVRLFATPWIAACQASLSITNSRSLLTHVHRVSDAIQPSHPLSSPSPPALNPSPLLALLFNNLHITFLLSIYISDG